MFRFLRDTYRQSLKSSRSDEWINTYAIRPIASGLVWIFYRLRLRPVQVVLLGGAAGTAAGLSLALNPWGRGALAGGALLLLKNLLDAADGQLARATGQVDRVGRFADSITDFWVNGWITFGAAASLIPRLGPFLALALGAAAFLLLLLQCSLFVFYQVSYLQRIGRSPANRTDERARESERETAPGWERRLQETYLVLYGWQDRLMAALDRRLAGAAVRDRDDWYGDTLGLRLTSFLGLGTSLTVYSLLLLAGRPLWALLWILAGETSVALAAILYRRFAFSGGRRGRILPSGNGKES
jgi:phosphatidylglycerophosphate synthase